MESQPENKPPNLPNTIQKPIGQTIYQTLLATEKPNDSQILLLSGAICLSQIIAQYVLDIKPRELAIFAGLKDFEIAEINNIVKNKRQALILKGQRPNKTEVVKISGLTKQKRRDAYIEGGFYTMTSHILLLDLLSKSQLKPQLISKIFFRDCETTKTYKDQQSWINHLVRIEGDTLNSMNTFTQTIVISQRVSRLSILAFQNIYRFFGLKRVVLWPFGREEIMARLKTSRHFQEIQHSLKFSQNETKINEQFDTLLKYCSSRWKGQQSNSDNYCYQLFTREMDEDLDYDYSDVLLLNMHQIRALMFKLSNFTPLSCYSSLMRFMITDDQRSLWTTTNKKAEGIIDDICYRMRRAVFQLKVAQSKDTEIMFFEQKQTVKISYSLKFLPTKPKKINAIISTLTKVSEQNKAKGTKSKVWVYASSEKMCQHIHDELYQWISGNSLLRKYRELYQFLIITRDRRLATIRHDLNSKKSKSPSEVAEMNENIIAEQLFLELQTFFKYYCDFQSNNLSNRDEQKHDILKQNLSFMQKELEKLIFAHLNINQILKPLYSNPSMIFYSYAIDLMVGGNTELIFKSCQQPQLVLQFLRLHNPQAVVLYNPNIKLLRSLYLYGINLALVCGTNFSKSLEQMIQINSLVKQDENFWQIGKKRTSMPQYCDDFRTRIAEISDFKIIGKSMLRYDPKNRAENFTMPTQMKNFVIIDKRQYKSQLPCILYFSGFTTVPIVLQTADYILSPDVAVQKKSVATKDIHESIRSGRLDDQLKRMSAKFLRPFLLIQFSKDIPFETQRLNVSFNHATRQTYRISIRKAVIGLLRKYPKVRVIWSHSCQETADIFLELKKNRLEPDITLYRKQDEEDLPQLASQERAANVVDL